MINIIDFIPLGHENAVKYDWLCKATGLSRRKVRLLISKARKEHIVLNMQDGKGFFRPKENEDDLITKFYRQENHRNREHRDTLRPIQVLLYFKGIEL